MTAKHGSLTHASGNGSLVDGLARSVILRVNSAPHHRRNRRIEIGSKILLAAVLDQNGFDQKNIIADLSAMRITLTDIIDHCIESVARELGEGWVDDRLSFAEVTVASARLFGLCKTVGRSWDNALPKMNSRDLLLVTMGREDHILGPAVLAEQLRRRGHSVRLHSNATVETLTEKLSHAHYDGVLVSVATTQALEKAVEVIQEIKTSFPDTCIVIGGANLNNKADWQDDTGADLVTNDIDEALDAMTGSDFKLRVAE